MELELLKMAISALRNVHGEQPLFPYLHQQSNHSTKHPSWIGAKCWPNLLFICFHGKNDNGFMAHWQEEYYSYLYYLTVGTFFANAVYISRESQSQPASQPASQVASNQFAISQNPRQQSNEAGMPMMIDNYSDQKQKELRLQSMQKALLVRDVSSGQKTWQLGFVQVGITEYWGCVKSSKQHTFPPASQPYCQWRGKHFMKGQFMKWYSAEIQQ